MLKIVSGLAIAVLLAACSSTPTSEQKGAAVEDRSASTSQQQKPQVVDSAPVVGAVPPSTTSGTALDPSLKDPKNILSKRAIFFDYDSNQVKEEYRPLVAAHARYLTQNKNAKMIIQGNTDERGSREYNLALGQRRADSVKQMMTVLGAESPRVETVSFGEEKPRGQGATEAAFAENRRADIVYQGE
ncbi:MAG: peptidoglycan-associated lipoprotein Pal [Burkholderiales bacterium]